MKIIVKKTLPLLAIATSLSLLSPIAHADWGVGLNAGGGSKVYKNEKNKFIGLGINYRGDKFNIDKGTMSYDLTNSNDYALEVIATSNNLGFVAKDNKTFKGMSKRKTSIDIGARAIIDTGLMGSAVIDVTKDVHASKGFEANIKLGGISPHAPHWTGEKTVNVAAVAGLNYKSAKVVDYHYGVKASEATSTRAAYKAKSALTPYVGVEAQANMNKNFTINGGIGFAKRAKSIRNSSITNDKKYDFGANVGFTYWF